jgi:hypothetical protein
MALPRLQWPLAFDSSAREPDFDPPGVVPAWLVRMADLTSWILIAALMYFLWLWTLDISGDRATPLMLGKAGVWELNTSFYWPLLIGFMGSAIGLPLLAKIGIPIFCELSFKKPGQGWPKFWMLILIILTSLVIIAGNMHVINGARLEKNREGAVRVELNGQARGALQANLDAINQDLADITNPALTTYQAQASREGAAAWAKRVAIAQAQKDYQADAIARALAAAERGDQLRKDRKAAMLALAAAPTQAAAAERIVTQGDWVTGLVDEIDRVRAVMLGAVQDLAALLLGWIAYRLAAVRKQQLADWEAVHAEPHAEAGIDLRLDDRSNETQVRPQETILEFDPETGEQVEKIRVRYKNEDYFRKKPTRKPRARKDDPRAPAANQVELQGEDEVSDEGDLQPGYREAATDPGAAPEQEIASAPIQEDQTFYASSDEEYPEADRAGFDASDGVLETSRDDADLWEAERSDSPEALLEPVEIHQHEHTVDAPLETPDEQALWNEVSETSELAEPENAETPLPNGEGIVVWDDEEEPTIKELLARTEAAE